MNTLLRIPILSALLALSGHTAVAAEKPALAAALPSVAPPSMSIPLRPCSSVTVDAPTNVLLGKSTVVTLSNPAVRMIVGGVPQTRAGRPAEKTEKADDKAPALQLQQTTNAPEGIGNE